MDTNTIEFYQRLGDRPYFTEPEEVDAPLEAHLRLAARAFLQSTHHRSCGLTRLAYILTYYKHTPVRPLMNYARNMGAACRCFECPQCQNWKAAGEPSHLNRHLACPSGMKALRVEFAHAMGPGFPHGFAID